MAHWSDKSIRLDRKNFTILQLSELEHIELDSPNVYLFQLLFPKRQEGSKLSKEFLCSLSEYCSKLNEQAVVCILTTPPDAATILPYLEGALKFHLWIAVKANPETYSYEEGAIPRTHIALLVLTRYRKALYHTKTRIKYTYCPACNKTTKDYGGKKHTYHEYGTLMSDVWRDIEYNPNQNVSIIIDRLRDLFGLEPHKCLYSIEFHCYSTLFKLEDDQTLEVQSSNQQIIHEEEHLSSHLFNEDCLEALSRLPENSIDFCFADPPYNLKKQYDRWNDALESIQYFEWCDRWLAELYRVLKPGHTLAVLNIPHWAVRHYQYLASKMQFQTWIVWEALSFPVRMIMPAHYTILCFSKGKPRCLPGLVNQQGELLEESYLNPLDELYCLRASCITKRFKGNINDRKQLSDLWHDIHRLKHNSHRVDHPCQLPPMLMRRLFALFTKPGEIVLDCFNGAGTSTLVAHQMQRRFIGVEISNQYHEIALKRHQQLEEGIDPFAKDNKTPKSKNSRVERLPKKKYHVSKKALQLEVKRITSSLGHLPTRDEVKQLSQFPIEYFDEYFISWGEVCAAARTTGMSELPEEIAQPIEQMSLFSEEVKH
ncbi:DNA methyltransferase [Leptolyngbya sp. O-77]|uniref:DNA methyltransferase n=1 Tax=Leptolyngbya sp. O-77 TaxID=1080068 RepID=UPI00074D4317|nr:DNA methyltransferase [Leptolyngbya sp. O-77]BAU43075.1 Modification methylase BamHI [Leptolyngbya sp. O-77]